MQDPSTHDQVIAKLQHFAEFIKQSKLEKETLMIVLGQDYEDRECLKNKILIYQEILEEYHKIFQDIIYR